MYRPAYQPTSIHDMTLTVVEVSSSITHPPAESILGQMTSKPEVNFCCPTRAEPGSMDKDADTWHPGHRGALHKAVELSDDVLAAIEGPF